MLPSLGELRKTLGRDSAPVSTPNRHLWTPTKAARFSRPSSPQFPVLCKSLPKIAPNSGIVCRLCLSQPESVIVLLPKYTTPRPGQIIRSSLEGWLKHDFVFFGKSYLCESCAKKGGFI